MSYDVPTNQWGSYSITNMRIIAYVDILGFRSKVTGRSQVELFRIQDALYRMPRNGPFGPKYDEKDYPAANRNHRARMTNFSDCFVISFPFGALDTLMPDQPGWPLDALGDIIGRIFHIAVQVGCLVRGGIVLGQLWHDEQIVFGPGIGDAYDIESKVAVYPRIILSEEAAKHFGKHPLLYRETATESSSEVYTCFNFIKASRRYHSDDRYLAYLNGWWQSFSSFVPKNDGEEKAKGKWDWLRPQLNDLLNSPGIV